MKIITGRHCEFDAMNLAKTLTELGYESELVTEIDVNDSDMYIIYQASGIKVLPKNYIIQQTEPCTSHWFSNQYMHTLRYARAVWDYSQVNINAYHAYVRNWAFVPPQIYPQKVLEKTIPKLFYGHIEGSDRRARILKSLPDIEIITNLTGPKMWTKLQQTETVYNIHYADDSPLELYRIAECLSLGCQVLTENDKSWDKITVENYPWQDPTFLKEGLKVANI